MNLVIILLLTMFSITQSMDYDNPVHQIIAATNITPKEKSLLLNELSKKIPNINQEHTIIHLTPLELATLQPNHDQVIATMLHLGAIPNKNAYVNAYYTGSIENIKALLKNYPKNKDPFIPMETFLYTLSIIGSGFDLQLIPVQKEKANLPSFLDLLIESGYDINEVIPNIGISAYIYLESNQKQWPDLFKIIKEKKS